MTKERICHTYLKYDRSREEGSGVPYREDIGGGRTEEVEICGVLMEEWGHTGVFFCPLCDCLDSMLPTDVDGATEIPPS